MAARALPAAVAREDGTRAGRKGPLRDRRRGAGGGAHEIAPGRGVGGDVRGGPGRREPGGVRGDEAEVRCGEAPGVAHLERQRDNLRTEARLSLQLKRRVPHPVLSGHAASLTPY